MTDQNSEAHAGPAAGYLDLYGLASEPFLSEMTSAHFYPGATREQRLNLMLHLAPLGEILLITAGSGVGKSTLLEQFVAKRKESWRLCQFDAGAGLDSNGLLQQLAQSFSPEALALIRQPQPERAEIERLLINQLQGLRKRAQTPMLLIDNAHNISESGFRALSKFIVGGSEEEKLLGMVLFSEPSIEEKLNNPALQILRAQIKHTFELPLLSEEETLQYVNHRMQAAGFQGESPFTASICKAIFGASKGLPTKINELAQTVLQNKSHTASQQPTENSATPTAAGGVMLPVKKTRISVTRLWPFGVAAVLASVLLFQDEINALFEAPSEKPQQVATKKAAAEIEDVVPQPTQTRPQARAVGDIQRDTFLVEAEALPVVHLEDELKEPLREGGAVSTETVKLVEESLAELPTAEVAQNGSESVVRLPVEERVVEELSEPAMVGQPLSEDVSTPPESQSEVNDGGWAVVQRSQAYTLQIVAERQAQQREEFIAHFALESDVERFSTDKKGQRWYVGAIGVYASRTAALEASRQLPKGVVPWVRSFASIQQELWRGDIEVEDVEAEVLITTPPRLHLIATTDQERWALARTPDHYVLQLVAFEKASKTRDFMKRLAMGDEIKQVRLINQGRVWYVAVFGDISDRETALDLADVLVKEKRISQPWARSFGSLQQAMRKFQQD